MTKKRSYKEILDWLFSQLPMYQRDGKAAYKANLDNTLALDKYFNHPHKKFKSIHVAGTNGKGSVSHMLASVLQESGLKVGLYTSPHLKDFRERIKINGEMIGEDNVIDFIENHQEIFSELKPSFFEMTVAMAFDYFAMQEVDIAVVEVGMGGRLDSTNIISPEISVITNIGLDHTAFLGNTKELIAGEKAGIIKENIPVIIGQTQNETEKVFRDKATEKGTSILFADQIFETKYSLQTIDQLQSLNIYKGEELEYPDIKLDLLGIYQRLNVKTALCAIEKLIDKGYNISNKNIYNGLSKIKTNTGLLGRWQILNHEPLTICDTGHNKDGIEAIVSQINNTAFKDLHIIFGVVNDKNVDDILDLLPKSAKYYFTRASIPRALDENELMKKGFEKGLKGNSYSEAKKALENAKKNAEANDLIFIGGSTFVVADIL